MSTLAMGWSRHGGSQMANLREYYYNGVSVGHIQALYGSGSRGLGLYAPNRLYFESPAIQLYKNNTLSTAIDMALAIYCANGTFSCV